MPIPPRLHRGEVYHARVPPAALFALAQNVATFMEAFLAIDALAWPAGAVGVVSKRLVRKNEKKFLPVPASFTIIGNHAGVAELADAYGSGPYGGNPVKVQVLSPAPLIERAPAMGLFSCLIRCSMRAVLGTHAALDAHAHSAMLAVGGRWRALRPTPCVSECVSDLGVTVALRSSFSANE